MSSPVAPQDNPNLIIIDSSVLLQLIAAEQFGILRLLRSDFGVQPAIVQAVESEVACILENVPKFRGRRDQFKKAIGNKTLAIVGRDLLAPMLGTSADAWIRQIESEGSRLYTIVDRAKPSPTLRRWFWTSRLRPTTVRPFPDFSEAARQFPGQYFVFGILWSWRIK